MTQQELQSGRRSNGEGSYSVLPNGKVRYQATVFDSLGNTVYKQDGSPLRVSGTGTTQGKAKKAYKENVDKAMRKLAPLKSETVLNLQYTSLHGKALSLHEGLVNWIQLYKVPPQVKAGTYDSYISISERIKTFFGSTAIVALTQDIMQTFFNYLSTPQARKEEVKDKGLSAKTINNIYNLLKEYLDTVVGKLIFSNPCIGTKRPILIDKEMRVMTQEEMEYFINEVFRERLRAAIFVSLFTGIRMGELLALKWDDVDLKCRRITVSKNIVRVKTHGNASNKTVLIVQDTPKTKKSNRKVPLMPQVCDILQMHRFMQLKEDWPNFDNLVFPSKCGTPTDPRTYQKRIEAVAKRCEVYGIGAHTLRHTFATRLSERNIPLHIIQKILGHASIETTMRYSHALDDEKEKAVDSLDDILGGYRENTKKSATAQNCTQSNLRGV